MVLYSSFGGYLYAGLSRKFIQVGDIQLSYFERMPSFTKGKEVPEPTTVIFVHGFSANKTMWMIMSKHLPKEWHLVMVDMPGHGESGFNPNGDYSSYGLADKLNEVRPYYHGDLLIIYGYRVGRWMGGGQI